MIIGSEHGVEAHFAGEKSAEVFVRRNRRQVGNSEPGVDAQQGVEHTALRAEVGDAVGRRVPGVPNGFAARLAAVIWLARFLRGKAVGAAEHAIGSADRDALGKVVARRLGRHLHDEQRRITRRDPVIVFHHHGVSAAVADLHVGQGEGAVGRARNVLAVLAPLVNQRRRAVGVRRESDVRAEQHARARRQRLDLGRHHDLHLRDPARDRAQGIADHHKVVARLIGLHVEEIQKVVGGPGDVRPVELPLKMQRSRAHGHDRELRGGADYQRSAHRLHGQNGPVVSDHGKCWYIVSEERHSKVSSRRNRHHPALRGDGHRRLAV